MADYNVNMKQWNGTSFDNVLPLAYNAKQLEGSSLSELKTDIQNNFTFVTLVPYQSIGGKSKTINVSWNMTDFIGINIFASYKFSPYSGVYALYLNGYNTNLSIGAQTLVSAGSAYIERIIDGNCHVTYEYFGGNPVDGKVPFDSISTIKLECSEPSTNYVDGYVEIIGLKKNR